MNRPPLLFRDGHRLWWPLTADPGLTVSHIMDPSGEPIGIAMGGPGQSQAVGTLFAAAPELVVAVERGINREEITGEAAAELRALLTRVGR